MTITGVFYLLVAYFVHSAFSTTTTSVESTPIPDGCPSDLSWEPHNQSCYLHLAVKVNFTQASESCEELGAHLVSITSGEENQFIKDLLGASKGSVWIGLYRPENEFCLGEACEKWMWLDGSELGYSQWATGPFPSPGQCTFMNPLGDWYHNIQCSDELDCVCEQKRTFPVTSSGSTTTMRASDMSEIYSSDPVGNAAPTMDSANNDQSSLYIGVSVTVGILVIVVVFGIMVFYIKSRRGKKRERQESDVMSNGTGEYVNHHGKSVGLYVHPLGGKDIEIHANQQGVTPSDDPHYEEIVKYSEINPEYTDLQPVQCIQTSAVNQEDNYEVYLNIEQN